MEIDSLFTAQDHENGAELNVVHPATSEPTSIYLRLAGVDSRIFRTAVRERQRLRSETLSKGASEDADLEEVRDVDILVSATLGWRGIMNDGEEMPFSSDAVRTLYLKSPGVRNQVERFIYNRRNFIKG